MDSVIQENRNLNIQKRLITLSLTHSNTFRKNLSSATWVEINKCINKLEKLYDRKYIVDGWELKLIVNCCNAFNIRVDEFLSKTREGEVPLARAIYAKIMTDLEFSPDYIATALNRNRTNTYNLLKKADNLISTEKRVRENYNEILTKTKIK